MILRCELVVDKVKNLRHCLSDKLTFVSRWVHFCSLIPFLALWRGDLCCVLLVCVVLYLFGGFVLRKRSFSTLVL